MKIKPIYNRWCVLSPSKKVTSCILALPGRLQNGYQMANWYLEAKLKNTAIIGITPENLEWYPMPNGAGDQKDAVEGQRMAIAAINLVINEIERHFNLTPEQIALVGYSAGGVMAIQTAAHSYKTFAGVVCHAGAILDPEALPECKRETPYYLMHNQDDLVFEWNERYLPMRNALVEKHYNVKSITRTLGGHRVFYEDVIIAGSFLSKNMKYDYDPTYLYEEELTDALGKVTIS